MNLRPSAIVLNSHTQARDFRAFARLFFEAATRAGLPKLRRWQPAEDGADHDPAQLDRAIEALPRAGSRSNVGSPSLYFEFVDGTLGSARFRPDQDGVAFCSSHLQRFVGPDATFDDLLAFQRQCLDICRDLLGKMGLHSVDLGAEGGGVRCVPEVPLVERASHIVSTDRTEVSELYDDPDAFWSAGWSVVDEHQGRVLLARDMDVVCGVDYLARINEHQWSMARAAKPGETRYVRPTLLKEEKSIFKAGKPRLRSVGYSPKDKLVEYSCALEAGQHIRGWEIYALLNILEQRRLADGSPVETVRIVFLEQRTAEQEKRPLLDIGCRVYHYGQDGELAELTE